MVHNTSLPPEQYMIRAGERGRLVLPASLRKRIGLQEGGHLVVRVEPNNSLRLVSLTDQIRRVQGIFKDIAPGVSLAEELIQERRAEVQRKLER
ncbi:MAG TPA: AbrB/MazE/SpoVT family DNA-binding domain-containing protein [Methylococcales bacterium]